MEKSLEKWVTDGIISNMYGIFPAMSPRPLDKGILSFCFGKTWCWACPNISVNTFFIDSTWYVLTPCVLNSIEEQSIYIFYQIHVQ